MGEDMNFRCIVIADDGEEEGERAANIAMNLAHRMKSAVILLGVIEPASIQAETEGLPVRDALQARRHLQKQHERFLQMGHDSHLKVSTEIREGDADEEITLVARREHADLIVVGHRHLSRFKRLLQGSTAEDVIRGAPCSVLVVQ